MRFAVLSIAASLFLTSPLLAQATAPSPVVGADGDAWPLYDQAARRIREGDKLGKCGPTASPLAFRPYPPFGAIWEGTAKEAYEFNASALDAVHRATALNGARWPVTGHGKDLRLDYLGEMRNVAIEVGDAAMFDHVRGRDVAAISRIQDLLHIADLLDEPKDELIVQALVGAGISGLACARLQVIATELSLTGDAQKPDEDRLVPVETLRALIKQLFTPGDPVERRMKELIGNEKAIFGAYEGAPEATEQVERTLRRMQMERNLTAMSLACQLIRFDKGRWASSLEEITAELPAAPADWWGPQGYVLIKHGRPDGSHRPLVYSRHGTSDSGLLLYPSGGPQFGYYNSGTLGMKDAAVAGQFRDVSLWEPGNQPAGLRPLK
jgi:hypothetical protein